MAAEPAPGMDAEPASIRLGAMKYPQPAHREDVPSQRETPAGLAGLEPARAV